MSLLRRAALQVLRAGKETKAGSWDAPYPGGLWGPGCRPNKSWMFGMTPPPEGERRIWESWEASFYFMCATMAGFVFFKWTIDPSLNTKQWARIHAKEREAAAGIDGATFIPPHLAPWIESIRQSEQERLDQLATTYGPLKEYNASDRRHHIW